MRAHVAGVVDSGVISHHEGGEEVVPILFVFEIGSLHVVDDPLIEGFGCCICLWVH